MGAVVRKKHSLLPYYSSEKMPTNAYRFATKTQPVEQKIVEIFSTQPDRNYIATYIRCVPEKICDLSVIEWPVEGP